MQASPSRSRLVLVEGLPGSGKSTTSHLLAVHLRRRGLEARWHYEHELDHPVFHYPDVQSALDGGGLPDGTFERALDRWEHLAATERLEILESSFLQTALHAQRLLGWTEARSAAYVRAAADRIRAADPLLVWIRTGSVREHFEATVAQRGEWFAEFVAGRIARSAWGRERHDRGADGVITYLEDYVAQAERLIAATGFRRLVLDADLTPRSGFVPAIARALGVDEVPPLATDAAAHALAGRYRDPASGDEWSVVSDGTHLFVDGTPPTRLIQEGPTSFELAGTCVRFDFHVSGSAADHVECTGPLPNLAREWVRQP